MANRIAGFGCLLTLAVAALADTSGCASRASETASPLSPDAGAEAGAIEAVPSCPSVTVDRAALLQRARTFSTQHGV